MRDLIHDQRGVTSAEYGVLAASMIAAVLLGMSYVTVPLAAIFAQIIAVFS